MTAPVVTLVSVTRFRARAMLFVPLFALHANRAIAQVHKADGFVAGAVQRDSDLAFWTMTVWRDEAARQAYVASGAHRAAMPHMFDWGAEASVTRWSQDGAELPAWSQAVLRMREAGRPSRLRHPGPHHAQRDYPKAQASFGGRL